MYTIKTKSVKPTSGGGRSNRRGSSSSSGGGQRRSSGGRRPSGGSGRGSSGGRGRSGGNKRSNPGTKIDPKMFINKNPLQQEEKVPVEVTHQFADFPFDANLKKVIAGRGYETPTPIQDQIIPHVLEGRDVIGLANTGTGKTAAFLLPLIHRTLKDMTQTTLIITPTRELAQQINEELRAFTPNMRLFGTVCVGGVSIYGQKKRLARHQHFIIGTPGRIIDLMKQNVIKAEFIKTVVLDEADRMLDMGFIADMRYIMSELHGDRNTLFFSATMSKEAEGIVHDFLNDPVTVSVVVKHTSNTIEQDVIHVKGQDNKIAKLQELLKDTSFEKVIVFGRTKHGVDKLSKKLYQDGISAESIHGNKSQKQRERALEKFKGGKARVLVATDVAARGIDVNDISHVINFDVPATYDDYVHRIGRTGRGGKSGKALTFVE